MLKERIAVSILLVFIFAGSVSAFTFTENEVNTTYSQINIGSVTNVYAYEINFDYTGTILGIDDADFLGANSSTTSGSSERDNILSVYSSQLNSSKPGVSGSGELFNVSHSGDLTRRFGLIVFTGGGEEYVYYNNSGGSSSSSSSSGGGGGGGGSGSGVALSPAFDFAIDPDLISVELAQGETKRVAFIVRNTGTEVMKIDSISADTVLFRFLKISENSFSLAPGGSKEVIVDVLAAEDETPESYIGKVIVSGSGLRGEVNFVIDVKATSPLFDVLVNVEDEFVKPGEDVTALIEVFNLGDLRNFDLLLYYAVKDFEGNVIASGEESLAIERRIAVIRQLAIPEDQAPGTYVLYVRSNYNDVQATGTKTFEVSQFALSPFFKKGAGYYVLIVLIIIGGVGLGIVVISIAVTLVRRRRRKIAARTVKEVQQRQQQQKEVYIGH